MYSIDFYSQDDVTRPTLSDVEKRKFDYIDWEHDDLIIIYYHEEVCIVIPNDNYIAINVARRVCDELNGLHATHNEIKKQFESQNIIDSSRTLYNYLARKIIKHHFSIYISNNQLMVDVAGRLATTYLNMIPNIWEGFVVQKHKMEDKK